MILTPRQAEIVLLISKGYTAVAVAPKLGLQYKTVLRHLDDAREANECCTIPELAAVYAREMERTKPEKVVLEPLADDLPRPLYEATCILGHRLWSQKQVEELVGRIALLEQTVLRLKTEIYRSKHVTEVSERGAVDATRASSS